MCLFLLNFDRHLNRFFLNFFDIKKSVEEKLKINKAGCFLHLIH